MAETAGTLQDRYEYLMKKIEEEQETEHGWGIDNSNALLRYKLAGVILGAVAVVMAALPEISTGVITGPFALLSHITIGKWATTFPGALSGACFLILQQLRLAQRITAHFNRSDLLRCLRNDLVVKSPIPLSKDFLDEIADKYNTIIVDTGKIFASVNLSLSAATDFSYPSGPTEKRLRGDATPAK